MKNYNFGTWVVPTICFVLFLYGMGFVMVYTYNSSFGSTLVTGKKQHNDLDPEAIFQELKKLNQN